MIQKFSSLKTGGFTSLETARPKPSGRAYARARSLTGFTLIELLVVIAIIGVLSSVVLASLGTARRKSRDARRLADIKQVQVALDLYFDANAVYPVGTGGYVTALASLVTAGYFPALPQDPLVTSGRQYRYCRISATRYYLGASLEDNANTALQSELDSNIACTGAGQTGEAINGGDAVLCDGTGAAPNGCFMVSNE